MGASAEQDRHAGPEWIWNTKLMPVGSSVSDCFLLCRVSGFATPEAGGKIE